MAKSGTRSGAAPGAPKPKIEPRRTPLLRRRWAKWVPVALLAILAAVLTPLLLSRVHRADAVRAYDAALVRALRPYQQHQTETVPDSFVNIPTRFRDGSITPGRLETAATTWREDFTEAAQNVRELTPPAELDDANEMIAQAMDAFTGVAGQYLTLVELQRLADAAEGRAARDLSGQVDAWIEQIDAARARAAGLLSRGSASVEEIKVAWGVSPPPEPTDLGDLSDLQIPPGAIPDGGEHPG